MPKCAIQRVGGIKPALHVAVVLGLLLFGGACGKEDPRAAFQRNDYRKALPGLRELSREGNHEASNMLGVMHYLGLQVPRDYERALKLFEKAALGKHPGAQFNAGIMHFRGLGTRVSAPEAYVWFYAAELQGKKQAGPYVISVGKNMGANQIMVSKSKARGYVPTGEEGSVPRAMP